MLDDLHLHDNGVPIYVQLRDQLSALIGRGALKPGERLPTMRQVAVALRIDLNTVQRAYAELERDGLLTLVRGRGTFVAETPPTRDHKPAADALAAKVAAQARALGITSDDLIQALKALKAKAS
jgi:GntR family transcriptional regulator